MNKGFLPIPRKVSRSPAHVAIAMVACAKTMAPAIRGIALRRGDPSSSPPMSSPKTKRTFAFAKLKDKNHESIFEYKVRESGTATSQRPFWCLARTGKRIQ